MRIRTFLTAVLLLCCVELPAQTPPALSVDVAANRHAISPDIYGINDYSDTGLANLARVGVRRWGGDGTNRYNWQNDTRNSAGDYYFENYAGTGNPSNLPNGSMFDTFVQTGLLTNTKRLGTISLLEWLPKSRDNTCSYSVAKYGAQGSVDPYHTDCGNGYHTDGTPITGNDPTDTSAQFNQTFQQQWIQYLISQYGTAERGGVQIWSLDNEPEWWSSVHMDIHPNASGYDEILNQGITYALAIKQTDPTALVSGYVAGGWPGMLYSRQDFNAGWSTPPYQFYDNPVDRNAHGGVPLVEWYLQQMQAYEQQHGLRLLDYLDLHAYIAPDNIGSSNDTATPEQRLTSTRVFWDPNYIDPATPDECCPNGEAPYLVPRMLQWVATNYPGTKTAITEYNWGALNDITGAIAEADILGIFGREGLDLATLWGPPDASKLDPGVFAFTIFTNYDGYGNQFGETSVSATTGNPDQLSIFAAQRSDYALTVLVLNKTTTDMTAPVSIANFNAAGTAQVWQYSGTNLGAIEQLPSVEVSGGAITTTYPAYSMTLLVMPEASADLPGPQPIVTAVGNAASYATQAIAPGEMIVIYGSNLGPASLTGAQLTPDGGYLSNNVWGVQVLVNGAPSPIVYLSANQSAAIVPYQTALKTSAAVQVEVNGVRSAPLTIPVAASMPALFSENGSGSGPGAILNQDLTLNSPGNPARAGDIIVLYATGEGQTTPPGVDGRLALDIRPVPEGACQVAIGGEATNVSYCGAAPYLTSGLIQINAQIPSTAGSGNLPVALSIGGIASTGNVTVAVQ